MKIGGLNVEYQGSPKKSGRAIELTELGKEKANDYAAEGPKLRVLLLLNRHGAMQREGIAHSSGLSLESVNNIIEEFATLQWVREKN